ncbi:probable palmitoyltransferase ZDHHC8 [Takifugu rubripes]|uniref:probable palmitoyltransferase ZDHHC8 n=1 Tax=Takifugu rubripes TaxID=31033 RepID=UPI001145BB39|nr:probable palmitoyltransferase ZDHHC8 [Takifugu rubripes]
MIFCLLATVSRSGRASDGKETKTPPPLPPKPDHGLLRGPLSAVDEVGHHTKASVAVSIPTVPQLRPVLEAISRGSSPIPPEQLVKTSEQSGSGKTAELGSGSKESPGRSVQQGGVPLHAGGISGSLTLNSRSLTLKHASRHGSKAQLPSIHADVLGSTSQLGMGSPRHLIASSGLLTNHSSLSYDNLIKPADAPFLAPRGVPPVGYHSHFMALGADGMQRAAPHSYSPVFMGVARQSPQPRDPSPFHPKRALPGFSRAAGEDLAPPTSRDLAAPALVMRDSFRDLSLQALTPAKSAAARYDGFSKTIMASIHERRDLEERERMLRLQARSQALYGPDMGIYDIPTRRSLPPDNLRPPGSRGPTPPAYGSREFLMSTGILGYGLRTSPLSSCSTSSLTRGPKSSSSPLQSGSSSSLQTKGQSCSPAYCTADRQTQPHLSSTSTLPRLPSCSATSSVPSYSSYATAKRSSLTYSSEGTDSVNFGGLK